MPEGLFQPETSIRDMLYDQPKREMSGTCPEIELTEQDIKRAEAELLKLYEGSPGNSLVAMAACCRVAYGDRVAIPPISDREIESSILNLNDQHDARWELIVNRLIYVKILRPSWYEEHPLSSDERSVLEQSILGQKAHRKYAAAAYQIIFPGSSREAVIRQSMQEDFGKWLNAFYKNEIGTLGLMETGYLLRLAFPDEWDPSVLTPELMDAMKRGLNTYRGEGNGFMFTSLAAEISIWTAQRLVVSPDGIVPIFASRDIGSAHKLPQERNY